MTRPLEIELIEPHGGNIEQRDTESTSQSISRTILDRCSLLRRVMFRAQSWKPSPSKLTGLAQLPQRKCSRCSGCARGGRQSPSSGAPKPSTTTRWMTWNGISLRFVTPRGNDRGRGHVASLLSDPDRRDRPASKALQPGACASDSDRRIDPRRCSRNGPRLGGRTPILACWAKHRRKDCLI